MKDCCQLHYDVIVASGFDPVETTTGWGPHRFFMRGLQRDDEAAAKIETDGFHAVEVTTFGDDTRRYMRGVPLESDAHRKD